MVMSRSCELLNQALRGPCPVLHFLHACVVVRAHHLEQALRGFDLLLDKLNHSNSPLVVMNLLCRWLMAPASSKLCAAHGLRCGVKKAAVVCDFYDGDGLGLALFGALDDALADTDDVIGVVLLSGEFNGHREGLP
jgi:hypothetical protein